MRASPNRLTVLLCVLGFLVGVLLSAVGLYAHAIISAFFGLGLVQLTEDKRRAVGARVREALRRADIPLKAAAAQMQMDQADLTRALDGERKLDLYRLEMLCDGFWQEYWPLLARDKGMPELFRTWAKALPVLAGVSEERSA